MSEKIIQNVQVNVDLKFNKDIAGLKGQLEKVVGANVKATGVEELLGNRAGILKSSIQGTTRNMQFAERTSAKLQGHLVETEKNLSASSKTISDLKGHFATVEGNIKKAVVGSDRWNDHYKQLDKIAIALRNEENNHLNLSKKKKGLEESFIKNENKRFGYSTQGLRQEQEGVRLSKARNENNQKIVKNSESISNLTGQAKTVYSNYVEQIGHLAKATKVSASHQDAMVQAIYTTNMADFKKAMSAIPSTSLVNAWGSGATQTKIDALQMKTANAISMKDLKTHEKMLKQMEIQGPYSNLGPSRGKNQRYAYLEALKNPGTGLTDTGSKEARKLAKDTEFEKQMLLLSTAKLPFDLRQAGLIQAKQTVRFAGRSPSDPNVLALKGASSLYAENIKGTLLDPKVKISLDDFRTLSRRYENLVYHQGGKVDDAIKEALRAREHSVKQLDLLAQRDRLVQQSAVTGFYDAQKIGHIEKQLGVGAYGASGAIPTQKYTYTSGKGLGVDANYQGAGKKLLQGITNQLDAGLVNINPGYAKKLVARQEELLLTRDIAMFKGQGNSTAVSRSMAQEKGAVATRTTQANALTATRLSTGSEALIGTGMVAGIAAGTVVVTGLATAFSLAVVNANKFENELANLGGVSSYSEQQIKQFSQTARMLGHNTVFGATEAMKAMTELSKLGYTMSQAGIMAGAIERSAALAGVSVGQSANMIGEIVHQFGLTATSATSISDTMAAAFNNSALDFNKLEQSLKYAGPLAAIAGANFKETAAALGVMADQGINASMAGTSMRKFFTVINKEGSESQKALRRLGLESAPLKVQMEALAGVFDTQAKVQKEFGIQASSGILAVFNKIHHAGTDAANGVKTFSESFDMITKDNSGLALDLMMRKTNTIAGQWERMKSNLEEIAISSASDTGIVGVFKSLVSLSASFVANLNNIKNMDQNDPEFSKLRDKAYEYYKDKSPVVTTKGGGRYDARKALYDVANFSANDVLMNPNRINMDIINKSSKQLELIRDNPEALKIAKEVKNISAEAVMSKLKSNTVYNNAVKAEARANNIVGTYLEDLATLKLPNLEAVRKKMIEERIKAFPENLKNAEKEFTSAITATGFREYGLAAPEITSKKARADLASGRIDQEKNAQLIQNSMLSTRYVVVEKGMFKAVQQASILPDDPKRGGSVKGSGGGKESSALPTPPAISIFYDKILTDQEDKYSKIGAEQIKLASSLKELSIGNKEFSELDKLIFANNEKAAGVQADYIKAMKNEAQSLAESVYNRAKGVLTEKQRTRLKEKVAGFSGLDSAKQQEEIVTALGLSKNLRDNNYHLTGDRVAEVRGSLVQGKKETAGEFKARQDKAVLADFNKSVMALSNILEDNKISFENMVKVEGVVKNAAKSQAGVDRTSVSLAYGLGIGADVEKYNKENSLVINQGKAAAYNPYRQISQKETIDITNLEDTYAKHQAGRDLALSATDDPTQKQKIIQDGIAEQTAMELERNKIVMQAWQDRTNKTKEYFDIATQGVNLLGEADNLRHQKRMADIDEALQKEIKAINHKQALGIVSARAAQRLQANAEKKAEEQKSRSFERNKSFQRANAYMQGASGLLSAVAGAMVLGPVLGPIMGVINSGIVLASMSNQIAAIDAQKYAHGGIIKGGSNQLIQVNERGTEAILTASTTSRLGKSGVDTLNRGGNPFANSNQSNNQTINITYAPVQSFGNNVNEKDMRRAMADDRRIFAEKMKDVTKRGYV